LIEPAPASVPPEKFIAAADESAPPVSFVVPADWANEAKSIAPDCASTVPVLVNVPATELVPRQHDFWKMPALLIDAAPAELRISALFWKSKIPVA
jgi:hypothetical protein